MKFKSLFYENKDVKIWVAFEGSGNPNDEHKFIGIEREGKTDCMNYSWGEDPKKMDRFEM